MPNYYDVLKIAPDAPPELVHAAYRALARKHHPDISDARNAAQLMAQLNAAYETLADPIRRREYDLTLAARVNSQNSGFSGEVPKSTCREPSQELFFFLCSEAERMGLKRGSPEFNAYVLRRMVEIELDGGKWPEGAERKQPQPKPKGTDKKTRSTTSPTTPPSFPTLKPGHDSEFYAEAFAWFAYQLGRHLRQWWALYIPATAVLSLFWLYYLLNADAGPKVVKSNDLDKLGSIVEFTPPNKPQRANERAKPNGRKPTPVVAPLRLKGYTRPATAPNGSYWPASAGYIFAYPMLRTDGLSDVTIDNSRNDTDVFVKLFALEFGEAIPVRHVFIPARRQFTIGNVRAGNYDVRYRDLDSGLNSKTETFRLSETEIYGGTEYTTISMTLYKIVNGNMQTSSISDAEFGE